MAGQDVLNPLDPDYKIKLIMGLKDKGFSYASIAKAMEMAGVDDKIKTAKINDLTQQYQQQLASGDLLGADITLGKLAAAGKENASAYMALNPSYKDAWGINVQRQNALTSRQWQKEDKAEQMKQQRDLLAIRQAQANQQLQQRWAMQQYQNEQAVQSLMNNGMTEQQARAYVYGKYRPTASGGGSGRSNANATTYKDASGITYDGDGNIVSYDKDTQEKYQELLDAVNEFGYDVGNLTGKGDDADKNARSATGDKLDDINKKLAMIKGRISDEDYEGLLKDAYAIAKQRQAVYGDSLDFH